MSTFNSPPGGSPRDRFTREAPALGIGVLPNTPGLSILPPVDRGVAMAAQLEQVLGLAGQAASAAGVFSESRRRRIERTEAAEERVATDHVLGLLRSGQDAAAIAEVDRLVASGALSESQAFALQERAESEIEQNRTLLETAQREIEQEQTGLGVAEADKFLATELTRIAQGQPDTLIADGASIAESVEDRLDIFLEPLPDAAADAFKRRAMPDLIRAHTAFADRQRRAAISGSITDRASALAAAETREERAAIVEGARELARRAPDLLTERDAVGGLALAASELSVATGNLKQIEEFAALAGGMKGEPLFLQFEKLRADARARRHELQAGQERNARESVFERLRKGEPITAVADFANALADSGAVSAQFAASMVDQANTEIERQAREAQKLAEDAAKDQLRQTILGGFAGVLADPSGPGLHATLADPNLVTGARAAGLSEEEIGRLGEQAIHQQMLSIEQDPTLDPAQKRSRQFQTLAVNGVTYEPWKAAMEQGVAAAGATMLIEGTETPAATLRGYQVWSAMRAENPQLASAHAVKPETRVFYEMVDLAKKHLYRDDPAAGIDSTSQAVRHVLRWAQSGVTGKIESDNKALHVRTGWIGDAYNATAISDEVRRLAELYLGAGLAPTPKDAIETANANVRASVQRVGDHYVYARDLRLPDKVADVAGGIVEGFADRYGSIVGLSKRHIALMPDPGGTGLWQMYDVSGGLPVPIQTSLPGGASLKPSAISFTPQELDAMASGILPPPDYAGEAVKRFLSRKNYQDFWSKLIAPFGQVSPAAGVQ